MQVVIALGHFKKRFLSVLIIFFKAFFHSFSIVLHPIDQHIWGSLTTKPLSSIREFKTQ